MIVFLCFFIHNTNGYINRFNCYLPEKCRFEDVYIDNDSHEKDTSKTEIKILCDINEDRFTFRFKEPTPQFNTSQKCLFDYRYPYERSSIIFRYTSTNEMNILDKRFNLTNALRYFNDYFDIKDYYIINFWDLKGFDVNIFDFGNYNIF